MRGEFRIWMYLYHNCIHVRYESEVKTKGQEAHAEIKQGIRGCTVQFARENSTTKVHAKLHVIKTNFNNSTIISFDRADKSQI